MPALNAKPDKRGIAGSSRHLSGSVSESRVTSDSSGDSWAIRDIPSRGKGDSMHDFDGV